MAEMIGFDGEKYIELQKNQIHDRLVNTAWRLYLQIDSLIKNEYTPDILPGYSPDTMKKIFADFIKIFSWICEKFFYYSKFQICFCLKNLSSE